MAPCGVKLPFNIKGDCYLKDDSHLAFAENTEDQHMHGNFDGDQALALGAIAAGIKMATSYPGSPSSGTMNKLIEMANEHDIYVEWSANERVAVELAIGASMAGRRSLVCTKSVGMNVMVDPLMCLNLTGVRGGLVILLGDDPGAYGSQNDQDTRLLAHMLELPMLEPASPVQGFEMMREAFDLSEEFDLPVILRVTRSYAQAVETFPVDLANGKQPHLGFEHEPYRFVPYPGNAVEMHGHLHQRLADVEDWAERSGHNEIIGEGEKGIIAVGFAYIKLLDVLGDSTLNGIKIFNLNTLYPIPNIQISQFLTDCEAILVLEEIDPFVEDQLKAIAFEAGTAAKIYGKRSGHVQWEGELYRWQILKALEQFIPGFVPTVDYRAENEADERPAKINHCQHYPYEDVLDRVRGVCDELKMDPIIIADPGCMVKVADQLDAKFAIGSAVAVGSGLYKAGITQKVVAFFGDSAFFHSTIPAICNAAYNQTELLMILLDNSGAASTGLQPSMGTGRDALGGTAPVLDMEAIAKACGVELVRNLGADTTEDELQAALKDGLQFRGLGLLMIPVLRRE